MQQQLTLASGTGRITAVVSPARPLNRGDELTLRDSDEPTRWWRVVEAFVLPHSVPRGWNNNI